MDPRRGPAAIILWDCSRHGLKPELLTRLAAAAALYAASTGTPLRVVSAWRNLHRQAELMAAMTDAQLLGLYARHGTPDYIARILARRAENRAPDTQQLLEILRSRTEGFVSSHLFGAAVDISADGADVELLTRLLAEHGFHTLDERDQGIACLHARYLACPDEIVRE